MTGFLIRRGKETQAHEERALCDDGGLQPQAKDHQGLLAGKPSEARNGQGRITPYRFQRKHGPANALISDF